MGQYADCWLARWSPIMEVAARRAGYPSLRAALASQNASGLGQTCGTSQQAPYPLPWAGKRQFVIPPGHPILRDPIIAGEKCGKCSRLLHRSGVHAPAGTWGYDGPRPGVMYSITPGCSADGCGGISGLSALGDWTDFDTSSLASKVAAQITGPVYESFKSQFVSDLPNIVQEIRPYLRQEVMDAIPTDMVDAMAKDAMKKAVIGGVAIVVATSLLTVAGVWLLNDMSGGR